MKLNLTQALTLAVATTGVVAGADANHDGRYSAGEIVAAVAQELQVAAVAVPELASALHTHPDRLQAAAGKIAEGLQLLVAP